MTGELPRPNGGPDRHPGPKPGPARRGGIVRRGAKCVQAELKAAGPSRGGRPSFAAAWLSLLLGAVPPAVPPPVEAPSRSSALRDEFAAILDRETAGLVAEADRLAGAGDIRGAAEVRAQVEPPAPADGASRIVPLPEIATASTPGGLPRVLALRGATARDLIDLAGRAAVADPPRFAIAGDCLRAALARTPDDPEVRRLLGYVPHRGGWATPFAADQVRRGRVLDPKFGWVDAAWVEHLERSELPAPAVAGRPTRWLPAAEADALRGSFDSGWTITTEHFEIQTDVPLAEVIAFGRRLEGLRDVFQAICADVIGGEQLPMARRLRDRSLAPRLDQAARPHSVAYFATKAGYLDHLASKGVRGLEGSLGYYWTPESKKGRPRGRSYFFRDEGGQLDATDTLYHEASHQLLFESGTPAQYPRNAGQYWVFEGLGTYFETIRPRSDGSIEVGGRVGPRFANARDRLVVHAELVPTEQLVAMGPSQLNDVREGADRLHYAEAMALTVYLMQGDEGRHREAFLEYVKDAYRGRLTRGAGRSLADRIGMPYATLDERLLAFLKGPATAPPTPTGAGDGR